MALTRLAVLQAMQAGDREIDRLERVIYRAKAREYRRTLVSMAHRYGEDWRRRALLSPQIREALRDESRHHARLIVGTSNRLLDAEAQRRAGLTPELLARHLYGYLRARNRGRSGIIATTERATARLDAQVAFFRENGIEPQFDFAGPPAKCAICKRLKAGGPWSIEQVVSLGYPHIGCRHSWRARTTSTEKLRRGGLRPGKISAGRGEVAGIVGGKVLLNREGSLEEALRVIEQMAG